MRATLFTLIIICGAGLTMPLSAGILAGPITNAANGHIYYLLTQSTWTAAEAEAVRLGGHLATINDQAENDWIWSLWGTNRSLWIGLNDAAKEGTFVWASGEAAAFRNWRSPEPNNGGVPGGNEDYVYIHPAGFFGQGQWNDYTDSSTVPPEPPLFGVVEIDPGCLPGAFVRISQVEVCWSTCTNRSYQVQYQSDLTTNAWVDLGAPISGNGSTNCIADAVTHGPSRRFYRVLLLP